MKCNYCLEPLSYTFRVSELIHFQTSTLLCRKCKEALKPIQQEVCSFCSLPLYKEACTNCVTWRNNQSIPFIRNVSLYLYEGMFKEMFTQYKMLGDYVLYKNFLNDIQKAYTTHFFEYHDIVIVPSHPTSIQKRGYHHLLPYTNHLPTKTHQIIGKVRSTNQKDLSVHARLAQSNFVFIGKKAPAKVLLFDDIYTTGASIMACAKLLENYGTEEISSLTIGRTPKTRR